LFQHVLAHIKPSPGSHIQCLAKITYLVLMYQYLYIGTRYVILGKHWILLPGDGFIRTKICWSYFYNFNYFNNL